MLRLILSLYWKLSGWKISGEFPYQYKKMVIVVAPHTHWIDIMVGFSSRQVLKIDHAKFLGKQELFKGPLGWLLRKMGGTPVDRFSKQGMVDQVAEIFAANEVFILALSPEGTRKQVNTLRTGFYHIARKAGVPILPAGLDYKNKRLVIGEAFYPGDDESADLKKVISFYGNIQGKRKNNDLRHLNDIC